MTIAEAGFIERRNVLQIVTNCIRGSKQGRQRFRAMETEDLTGTEFLIIIVRELGQLICCFIGKPNAILIIDPLEGAIIFVFQN